MIAKVRPVLLIAFIGLCLMLLPAEIRFSMNNEPGNGIEFSVSFHSESPLLDHVALELPVVMKAVGNKSNDLPDLQKQKAGEVLRNL